MLACAALCALACASIAASSGCSAPADANVLLDLDAFKNNGLPALRAPRAILDVKDEDGTDLAVDVKKPDGETVYVQSPLPVPCNADGICNVALRVRPNTVTFTLHVRAHDRCGAEKELVRMTSEPIALRPYDAPLVELANVELGFDDDDDGLVNILEHATCGRFDVKETAAPPQACRDEDDVCCAGVSPLEGHMTAFAGGAFANRAGAAVTIGAFALDATEVTWRQLARCVAAGACLVDQPTHPVREALTSAHPTEPVVGLLPSEADELCAFFAKRLPTDDEWDFAAAHRAGAAVGERARYPWDADTAADEVGCSADSGGVTANFSIPGTSCPGAPLPVATYTSSYANVDETRGVGGPLADLGGNVAEWTLVPAQGGDDPPSIAEVPAGHTAAVLRGGGAQSPLPLLENDFAVVAAVPTSGDVDAWRATVVRLAATAGVRCATSVADASVAPSFAEEPSCE
jgi:formylglycine-generating enzyme required for sulfatase activity